jgi:hypothetical protein
MQAGLFDDQTDINLVLFLLAFPEVVMYFLQLE